MRSHVEKVKYWARPHHLHYSSLQEPFPVPQEPPLFALHTYNPIAPAPTTSGAASRIRSPSSLSDVYKDLD